MGGLTDRRSCRVWRQTGAGAGRCRVTDGRRTRPSWSSPASRRPAPPITPRARIARRCSRAPARHKPRPRHHGNQWLTRRDGDKGAAASKTRDTKMLFNVFKTSDNAHIAQLHHYTGCGKKYPLKYFWRFLRWLRISLWNFSCVCIVNEHSCMSSLFMHCPSFSSPAMSTDAISVVIQFPVLSCNFSLPITRVQ